MIDKENVLQLVRMKGYVLPSDLTRQFHTDTFIMGAVLSDLVREKKLVVSTVKVGRSPVYYTPTQREQLQELYPYLDEKDKRTYELLKEKIVLRDIDQTPLVRLSLKLLKDFAKPIEVTVAGKTELFYKWYLATDQDVHSALTQLLALKITPVASQRIHPMSEATEEVDSIPKRILVKEEKKVKVEHLEPLEKQTEKTLEQQPLIPVDDQSLITRLLEHDDPFVQSVVHYLQKKSIQLLHFTYVKKGELDCLVKVPSSVGDITYFCKAKKKRNCSEGDLATAFVAGQMKKLPVLFITSGHFPTKVMQKLPHEYPNTKILLLEASS